MGKERRFAILKLGKAGMADSNDADVEALLVVKIFCELKVFGCFPPCVLFGAWLPCWREFPGCFFSFLFGGNKRLKSCLGSSRDLGHILHDLINIQDFSWLSMLRWYYTWS